MKYVAAGLCAALLLLGWLYRGEVKGHADTKAALAVAEGVNKANVEATKRLERSMSNTDDVLAKLNEDRTTLAGVRIATRQAIKEAMRDESFKAWASSPAHGDADRLLNSDIGADGNDSISASNGASSGLSRNAAP